MNQISTLTVTAEDEWPAAAPANMETLDPPEPVVVTGRGPGRRAIEIAVAAALLLHALVLTIALVPMQWWGSKAPPPPIPVTVVFEPPKPPPPPPAAEKPEPPPPPPAPSVPFAQSGPDNVTKPAERSENPPSPAASMSEPAPQPQPDPAPEPPAAPTPATAPALPSPVPATQGAALPVPPPASSKPAAPQPPHPASKPRASVVRPPKPLRPTAPKASGEETTGDVYLNQVHALIDQRIRYPNVPPDQRRGHAAVFRLILDRSGGIADLRMARSSGDELLDQVFEEAIRRAAPFPRPPFKYTGDAGGAIWITMPPPWA